MSFKVTFTTTPEYAGKTTFLAKSSGGFGPNYQKKKDGKVYQFEYFYTKKELDAFLARAKTLESDAEFHVVSIEEEGKEMFKRRVYFYIHPDRTDQIKKLVKQNNGQYLMASPVDAESMEGLVKYEVIFFDRDDMNQFMYSGLHRLGTYFRIDKVSKE